MSVLRVCETAFSGKLLYKSVVFVSLVLGEKACIFLVLAQWYIAFKNNNFLKAL